MPEEDRKLLESIGWKKKLDQVDSAIQANAQFLRKIIMNPDIFGRSDLQDAEEEEEIESDQSPQLQASETLLGIYIFVPAK